MLLLSKFSPQAVVVDSGNVPLTLPLEYSPPPWVSANRAPEVLEPAADAPATTTTAGAASSGPAGGLQLLHVKFPSKDEKTLMVSYTTMTVNELTRTISDSIRTDMHWAELAQKEATTPQELCGLLISGRMFESRGAAANQLLCQVGMHKECTVFVIMKSRRDNSKSPESHHAASSYSPRSTDNASHERRSASWELPRGPKMNDPRGAPLYDGNGEQLHVGDIVASPHGSMDGQTMGIALFCVFSKGAQIVRVRYQENYRNDAPGSLAVFSSRSTTPALTPLC